MNRETSYRRTLSIALAALFVAGGCAATAEDEPLLPSGGLGAPVALTPRQPSAPSNPHGTGESVSTTIDNSTGGAVRLTDGTAVEVPAGALPDGVDAITVTSSPGSAPTEYSAFSPVFVFGPDGAVFKKPLKVSIPVVLPAGVDVSEVTVLWSRHRAEGFDMVPSDFVPVPGRPGSYIATAQVTHFSQGMCGRKYVIDPHPAADPYGN